MPAPERPDRTTRPGPAGRTRPVEGAAATPAAGTRGRADRHIVFLAFPGVRQLDITGPLEVFATARALGAPYRWTVCSPDGADVLTPSGRLAVDTPADPSALEAYGPVDTVVVPGSADLPSGPPPDGLLPALHALTTDAPRPPRRVASVCTGAFALAAAGLLDHRRATTHWRHAAALARRHPLVRVEPDAIHVRDGHLLTSAGVTAGIDLALAMLEADTGPDLAREVARDLVVFMQRPGGQSQFSTALRTPPPRHDLLRGVVDAVTADPAADHSATALAARAGLSVRHLTRLFHDQLGTTPAAYVEAARIEAAQALLASGDTVTGAARRSGFGSDESMRRAFARRLGVTPSAYRTRFRTTTGSPTGEEA
ncbi:GlxA family transcriptional regulator [Yinghuangia seranimata]|uniref:GlxA family transcriptional regulator n=1 Tax=Yinghuangia seranimata TaxID=408067 RepID=UPI00248CC2DD|nr:helix-turn-helix domain-containing protein [Yinghuangia seranimata]MDI2129056.1 helix-turn-helix domain-containing protein [Yinghuangia seranimata]